MPMMNNGAAGVRPPMPANDNRSQLNTYIYEYFLRNGMFDCARSLLNSDQPMNVIKDSPGRRRDENGGDEGADVDSKDDIDSKRPVDLPEPNLPKECPESCFLYEWWCLFWDMFNAQRGKGDGRNVLQYVTHTQAQSRMRQEQQQVMLRGLRGDMQLPQGYQQAMMMRSQTVNNMNLNQNNELRQKAIQNNRNATPNNMMLGQQKQQQQQMQRDPSDGNNQQRPQSPGSAENAPSPSKRPRLDQPQFNPQQMPNGRGQMPQQVGETGPSNAIQAAHMQLTNGIEPNNLTAQQFQVPGGANTTAQARSLAGYQANLAQQQAGQMPGSKVMPNPGGAPNQGSPMMTQGQDGGAIANYYNPGDMAPNGLRAGVAGQPGGGGGNHALQDYQMQLMLLEQQNKKRLMMARQEQDSMMPRGPDGSGGQAGPGMGTNGQPFQGTSPQGPRSVNSPNPGDQMKRGTPHMNPGMASPLPEPQSRGSPGASMNFNIGGGPMDPNAMGQQFFNGGMPNGMRPPSSHPAPGRFNNNQITPQQMAMAQQQQAGGVQNWQNGPNGQMMPQQGVQGAPQQNMGTPQQRAMPPPSAPAAGAAANGRTQPSSPQQNAAPPTPSQTNKANPKKKNESKDSKTKRAAKKGSAANLNAGATPSADAEATAATPTPATPITPHNKQSFAGQNGAVQPVTNGQPTGPAANTGVVSQPDPLQGGGLGFDNPSFDFPGGLDFAASNNNNMDVLQDFDFDSFLHQDGGVEDSFNFDTSAFLDENTIGAD
ncbi:hypothetical protein NA56DRAFT_716215 [Hyaloscypha hepaticicola]|uniref:Uncharacterized protein n=1 Tax=Hyaloscypha hepaticicola TaxID=2082293 RepID=A0A2J6QBU8_9HELO|nr:hypothetical protein NA56DRAFT_716215 [Hyaloscypha hepaticicola]